jgi:hypothetical protein
MIKGYNNEKSADTNRDHKVSVVELGIYSKQKTSEMSKKLGHA